MTNVASFLSSSTTPQQHTTHTDSVARSNKRLYDAYGEHKPDLASCEAAVKRMLNVHSKTTAALSIRPVDFIVAPMNSAFSSLGTACGTLGPFYSQ